MLRFFFLALLCCSTAFAQSFTNVMLGNINDPNEISIAISTTDTNLMVAGANTDNLYYSTDAGHNWQSGTLTSPYGVFGDPCIMADTAGHFYYFHLAQNDTIFNWPAWADRIVCQRSTDAGQSWSNGTFTGLNLPHMQDKEWCALDPATNYIAVCWTEFDEYNSTFSGDSSRIWFSLSKDAGQTWSTPVKLSTLEGNCLDSDETVEGAMPAFGLNGEVYVVWAYRDSLYFLNSLDTGNTWLPHERAIAAQPSGWDYEISGLMRCNGLPITVVDHSSSAYSGTIYINWSDKRNGVNDADVWLMKSTDGGNNWTAPLRVNGDAAGRENFMSWMAIDEANGELYIVYYDRRNHSDEGTDVYLARSTDSGNTFTEHKISSTPFYPQANVFFGDYIGVTARNGCVRPAWMRMDGGSMSAWTAIVSISDSIAPTAIPEMAGAKAFQLASANPTTDACIVHYSGGALFSVRVTDVKGQVLFDAADENETAKLHLRELGFSSGMYFVHCCSCEAAAMFKVVLK